MTRLVRAVDPEECGETVMVLGGEHGLVALHMPGGIPDCMVLHAPFEVFGWVGPCTCRRLEGYCWSLSSITGPELLSTFPEGWEQLGEEHLWRLMEHSYGLYLESLGRRRR